MKYVLFIFMGMFFSSNVYGFASTKTVAELVVKIANTTPAMQYSFWITKDADNKNIPFLAKNGADGSFRVWHFTLDKLWQPVHNASESGKFSKADKVFENIELNKANGTIIFGAISSSPEANQASIDKAKLLENKEFNIGWYFWVNARDPFLFKKNQAGAYRIWHFTTDKKWKPVHNASAFDGFAEAKETLEGLSFDLPTGVLTIGAAKENPSGGNTGDTPSFPKGITLTSSAMKTGEFLNESFVSVSPPLSWSLTADAKSEGLVKSYAISLKDLDAHKFHWHMINIPSSVKSITKGPVSQFESIPHDFGSSGYKGPFPPKGETHNYKFTVYAFSTEKIEGMQDYKYAIYESSIIVKYTGK